MSQLQRFLVVVSGAYTGLVLVLIFGIIPLAIFSLALTLIADAAAQQVSNTSVATSLAASVGIPARPLVFILITGSTITAIVTLIRKRIREELEKGD